MKALAYPLDQHFQALKPRLQVLKALELEPTLPDWHLRHVVTRRTWITHRSNGLYAAVAPGKEQDSQGMASKAASLSHQHIPTVERCFQRPHLIRRPDLATWEHLQ